MNVRGEDQSAPKDILNNMIYSCIIFQGNEIVCQVTKLYTHGCISVEKSVVSSMFQNYNLLQSCFSFSTLLFSLLPLNLMLGTLILLEDYQIQILKNLWCTISWGGTRINSLSFLITKLVNSSFAFKSRSPCLV